MVEGPGATRNGKKLQRAVGYIVTEITATFKESDVEKSFLIHGQRFAQVFSVGKEVFLIFHAVPQENDPPNTEHPCKSSTLALRLHFGMVGSLWVRNAETNSFKRPYASQQQGGTIQIRLKHPDTRAASSSSLIVEGTNLSSTLVSANVAQSKLTRLAVRDVCGSIFQAKAVLEACRQERSEGRMICDIVLDQNIFPGVGNVIKIEGLHYAGVHPRRLVSSLSDECLRVVISECRKYAMAWFKTGRAPAKRVYNQTVCGTCKNPTVRMVKMGNDLTRVTFWCDKCQPWQPIQNDATSMPPSNTHNTTNMSLVSKKRPSSSTIASFFQPQKRNDTTGTKHSKHSRLACPQHGSKALLLKRVRKRESPNLDRLFCCCKNRDCPYFAWADTHFPKCPCGRLCVLRVSKTQSTGGRWFLSCRSPKPPIGLPNNNTTISTTRHTPSCSFFQWATTEEHLAPLGESLSPLL